MSFRGVVVLGLAAVLLLPAPAYAASGHGPLVTASILGSLGGLAGSVFSGIGHAVLGAFSWTIGLASKFLLTTIAALVRMLIPRSWVHEGLQIMEWIVAVPDYAGKITTPGGGHVYGFAGINALRDLFMWLGIAIAPLTLVYATSRAMIGEGDPVAIPVLRMLVVAIVIAGYPYWWSQAAALADQVTNAILTIPDVSRGLYKLMDYAVDGVALGGWQLIDLGLMAAIGSLLLGLIFLKVVVILLGALLYATGPVTIGLVPTRAGSALARAWASAAVTLLGLGIAWATLFAVGALLIGDAGTAGPLIAGNSTFGSLAGGLLLAVAGVATLWLCLTAAREAAGLLRLQLSGLLVLARHNDTSASAQTTGGGHGRTTASSLRDYGSRLAGAAGAATGELALAGAGGAALAGTARSAARVGRRGLVGTAASGARAGVERAAVPAGAMLGRSRAGAVAVRMARAGTASWTSGAQSRATAGKPFVPERGSGGRRAKNAGRGGGPSGRPVAEERDTRSSRAAAAVSRGRTSAIQQTDTARRGPNSSGPSAKKTGGSAQASPSPRTPGASRTSVSPPGHQARSPEPKARPTGQRGPSAPNQPVVPGSPPANKTGRPQLPKTPAASKVRRGRKRGGR